MALQHALVVLAALVTLQVLLMELIPMATAHPDPISIQRLVCSMLPIDECAFAVDSAGNRCVLETLAGGVDWHVCQTSDIMVTGDTPTEYIETDQCVKACGVTKMTVGLSTDALTSRDFTSKLCSSNCQENCPNLVDLYSNLAAAEGHSLRMTCKHRHRHLYRETYSSRLRAAGEPAPAPAPTPDSRLRAAEEPAPAPAPTPDS